MLASKSTFFQKKIGEREYLTTEIESHSRREEGWGQFLLMKNINFFGDNGDYMFAEKC